uniref:Uncharacterized protein n=1 Tax=uncultured Thiotrichaceae bacterium TaxID=298394 RepID=A0A6S6SPZ3_9GAMM|nr:MAG: Unknown protein [uncultured Thiotrichaceae bacterium]
MLRTGVYTAYMRIGDIYPTLPSDKKAMKRSARNQLILILRYPKMKKTTLAIALAATFAATTVSADYPEVIIDSDILLNYDQEIDMTSAVTLPSVSTDALGDADISVNQFNHDSPVSATGSVIDNTPTGVDGQAITDLQVNVTAVGNNASIELDTDGTTVGAVQGNQNGGASATGEISGNRVDLDKVIDADGNEVDGIVELNVTAVGNNLTIDGDAVKDAAVGSMQFNYDSPVNATGTISGNGFGVDPTAAPTPEPVVAPVARDPKLAVTAVGNNLSSIKGTTGSMTQINRNSPIAATGLISGNTGFVGPVSLDVTAVGNNISIKGAE